jgi:hypothetical protein
MRLLTTIRRLAATFILPCCLAILLSPGSVYASWCHTREDTLRAAPVIFAGKVLSITRDRSDDIALLSVSKAWRGTIQQQAVVHTGGTARDCGVGNCGYKFTVGDSYLVFAYEWPAQPGFNMNGALTIAPGVPTLLMTDICSRTSLLSAIQAQQDLETLGTDRLPATGSGGLNPISDLVPYLVVAFTLIVAGFGLQASAVALRIGRRRC